MWLAALCLLLLASKASAHMGHLQSRGVSGRRLFHEGEDHSEAPVLAPQAAVSGRRLLHNGEDHSEAPILAPQPAVSGRRMLHNGEDHSVAPVLAPQPART